MMRGKRPFVYVKNGEVKINYSRSLLERIVDGPIGTTLRCILIIFLLYKASSSAEIGKWTLMFLAGFWLTFEAFAYIAWDTLKELWGAIDIIAKALDKQKSEIDQELERLKNRD